MTDLTCPHCGGCFEHHPKKNRSLADHRRFFAMIDAAFHQWPEHHEFRPLSSEHLRAWLLCKIRHHEVEVVEVGTEIFEGLSEQQLQLVNMIVRSAVHRSIEAAVRTAGFAFDRPYGSGIAIFRPKSINWDSIEQPEFNKIRDAVEIEIEKVIGVPPAQLLTEARNAA
jgi:hypothetical protein